ncbi:hypothetical protein [Roseinatronobacter sp. NSM]|uniref:hypothetical protein n=1 Tax=Roseinatronobacter sp. NSM TaxID=3457785 RepID=UPI004036BF3A
MELETLFLLGVYLLPLAMVSTMAAWTDSRKPVLGLALLACSGGLLAWVWVQRPDGLYTLRDIPELTVALVARLMAHL